MDGANVELDECKVSLDKCEVGIGKSELAAEECEAEASACETRLCQLNETLAERLKKVEAAEASLKDHEGLAKQELEAAKKHGKQMARK